MLPFSFNLAAVATAGGGTEVDVGGGIVGTGVGFGGGISIGGTGCGIGGIIDVSIKQIYGSDKA